MLLGICASPGVAWDYALAHTCLKRLGYEDVRFDSVLELIAKSQAARGRERPPHRVLEQIWAARALSEHQSKTAPDVRATVPRQVRDSVLCNPIDLLGGSREDVYAFTHALMYVTDFNIQPWKVPRRKIVLAVAEAALAGCLDDQDYDLAGEVLLAWPLIGTRWSAAATFGFRVLAHVEDEAGFLPSVSTQLDRLKTLQGDERANYLLATAYHTVYVMGLLCAVALQPLRAPPLAITTRRSAAGSGQLLLARLDDDTLRPHWRKEIDRLGDAERDSLAGLFLTIALRRSAKQRDFARIHELLQFGRAAGLTEMPSASQAAELLERLAFMPSVEAR